MYNAGVPVAPDSVKSTEVQWLIEEGTGSTVADSTGTNDGTISGATWSTDVPDGNQFSLDFDGVGDWVEIADNNELSFGDASTDSPFSIVFWFNPNTTSTVQRIVSKSNSSNSEYLATIDNSGKLVFALYDLSIGQQISAPSLTSVNTVGWKHVVLTYDGSGNHTTGFKIYLNNSDDTGTGSLSGSYTAMHNTNGALRLGYWEDVGDGGNLKIANLAIVKRVLTSDEVSSLYNGGTFINPADIIASSDLALNIPIETGHGSSITDSSPNAFTGTITNATWSTDVP